MAKTDVWMPLYIGSYLADTMHLETVEHGAYCLLLLYGWRHEGKIPMDDPTLAKITKMPLKAWIKARLALAPYFHEKDGCWNQKRQIEELEKVGIRAEKARANGLNGGDQRTQPVIQKNPAGYL